MAQWDRMDVDGSPMRLYVGMPSLGRAFPAVIVVHHGPGVDKFIEDRVENLAQQGYLAIAPDLYHRQTSTAEDGACSMLTRIGRLRDPEVITDVNAAVNYARRLKDTQLGDVGIIGFCMGGRVAYLMAASKPVFKAAARLLRREHHEGVGERPDSVRPDAVYPLPDRGFLRRGGCQSLARGRGPDLKPSSTSTARPTSSIATRRRGTPFSTSRTPPPIGRAPRVTRGTSSSRSCSAPCRRAASRASG